MDMTGWLEYFIKGLAAQLAEVKRAGRTVLLGGMYLSRSISYRSARPRQLATSWITADLTIQDFEGLCPEVNRRYLQRDLKAMIEKEIMAEKATSTTDPIKRYVLMEGHSRITGYDKM